MSNKYDETLEQMHSMGQGGVLAGGVLRLQSLAYTEGLANGTQRLKKENQQLRELVARLREQVVPLYP